MSDDTKIDENHKKLTILLSRITRNIDLLIHEVSNKDNLNGDKENILRILFLMIQSMGVSVHSILTLISGPPMGIKDCYGIARSVFEMAVNISYICYSGVDVAEKANRHAFQKSYRDFHREGDIGGIKIDLSKTTKVDPSIIPGLQAALDEFTRRGKENPDWTPLNISQRISEVKKRNESAAISLAGASFSIYRHSSELLHGTYFSVVYFWTLGERASISKDSFQSVWEQHFMTIFNAVFFSCTAVIEVIGSEFDCCTSLNMSKESNNILKEVIMDIENDRNLFKV